MNGILLSFLVILIGCINLNLNCLINANFKQYLSGQIKRLKFGIPFAAIMAYIGMPALVLPDILFPVGVLLLINSFYTIFEARNVMEIFRHKSLKSIQIPLLIIILIIVGSVFIPLISVFNSDELYKMANVSIDYDLSKIPSEKNIVIIPQEYVRKIMEKQLDKPELNLKIGEMFVQNFNGSIHYVATLEYKDFFGGTQELPGYIIFNAEKSDEKPKIVETKIVYSQKGLFEKNLYRKIYSEYPEYRFEGFRPEIDDNGNLKWIVSAVIPTYGFGGEILVGLVIADPFTGELVFYKPKRIPDWVDVPISENIANENNRWFGNYKEGYINYLFFKKEVFVPGKPKLVFVNESMKYLTDFSVPFSKDKKLTGISILDARTGKTSYYKNNSIFNSDSVTEAVNAQLSDGAHSAEPQIYNIYGELTYVTIVLSKENEISKVSIVHGQTGQIFIADNLEEALLEYKSWLETDMHKVIDADFEINNISLSYIEGVVERVRGNYIVVKSENKVYDKHIFRISGDESFITYENDRVKIGFIDSEETIIDALEFDNLEYAFR